MKTRSRILAVALSALFVFSGNTFAQQAKSQQKQVQRTEKPQKKEQKKTKKSYKTEYFYFTNSKYALSTIKKKLLKMSGVKEVSYSYRRKRFKIKYDTQKAPQTTIKKSMKGWGTPGDFNKPNTTKNSNPTKNAQKRPAQPSQKRK